MCCETEVWVAAYCSGPCACSATEVKDEPFFTGIDWNQVYHRQLPPPITPPRGEVNAADAFDIGSFDEEDTKGIKVSETPRSVKQTPYCHHEMCLLWCS